jgi:hypothetical protein
MGEILGLGLTHYPPLIGRDEHMADILRLVLADPGLPARLRDPAGWPEPMRQEYGADGGATAAAAHRAALVGHLREIRRELDAFRPDLVLVWGDDQHENFVDDIIPPFCVLAYDAIEMRHGQRHVGAANVWREGSETVFRVRGHREAGKYLTRRLLEQGVDMAYAYRPLHHPGLAHAFFNTILFLDYDRAGFPYPVLPFQVNCYGRRVIAQRGFRSELAHPPAEADLDPPSPTPRRCLEVGAATARAMRESPWRVALVASSSWSHAFLTDKHHQLYPDTAADRRLHAALRTGDYEAWRRTPLADIEASGQQEMLNWCLLAGAMEELGRKPDSCELVETWIFNSNKCFAVFRP